VTGATWTRGIKDVLGIVGIIGNGSFVSDLGRYRPGKLGVCGPDESDIYYIVNNYNIKKKLINHQWGTLIRSRN
jgi:hypothetical protein